jgi:hypothetical protein
MRCIWYGQHLDLGSLRTVDGESVKVVSPGWWNVESGPDFLKAELSFGEGPVQRGDIEMHLYSSGWYDHQHHEDPGYNSVLLHVVLWNDRDDGFVVNQLGQPVRQLILEDNVQPGISEVLDQIEHEDFPQPSAPTAGLCRRYAEENKVGEGWIAEFLDHAGDERILRKAQAMARRAQAEGEDQVFYEALMGALGYKKNKKSFEALARAVPLAALRELPGNEASAIQACLFSAAGLFPAEDYLPGMPDPETHETFDACRQHREKHRRLWQNSPLRQADWDFSGTRPVNFPMRRIAAASHFLARNLKSGLLNIARACLPLDAANEAGVLTRRGVQHIRKAYVGLFAAEDPYWSFRCVFGGKRSPRPLRLVGQERVDVIFVNVILPALLCRARLDDDPVLESLLHQVYDGLPVLSETHVTRFMVARIFGDEARAERLITSARRQQGLYQLYTDFERDDRTCEDCAFARAMLV